MSGAITGMAIPTEFVRGGQELEDFLFVVVVDGNEILRIVKRFPKFLVIEMDVGGQRAIRQFAMVQRHAGIGDDAMHIVLVVRRFGLGIKVRQCEAFLGAVAEETAFAAMTQNEL